MSCDDEAASVVVAVCYNKSNNETTICTVVVCRSNLKGERNQNTFIPNILMNERNPK